MFKNLYLVLLLVLLVSVGVAQENGKDDLLSNTDTAVIEPVVNPSSITIAPYIENIKDVEAMINVYEKLGLIENTGVLENSVENTEGNQEKIANESWPPRYIITGGSSAVNATLKHVAERRTRVGYTFDLTVKGFSPYYNIEFIEARYDSATKTVLCVVKTYAVQTATEMTEKMRSLRGDHTAIGPKGASIAYVIIDKDDCVSNIIVGDAETYVKLRRMSEGLQKRLKSCEKLKVVEALHDILPMEGSEKPVTEKEMLPPVTIAPTVETLRNTQVLLDLYIKLKLIYSEGMMKSNGQKSYPPKYMVTGFGPAIEVLQEVALKRPNKPFTIKCNIKVKTPQYTLVFDSARYYEDRIYVILKVVKAADGMYTQVITDRAVSPGTVIAPKEARLFYIIIDKERGTHCLSTNADADYYLSSSEICPMLQEKIKASKKLQPFDVFIGNPVIEKNEEKKKK